MITAQEASELSANGYNKLRVKFLQENKGFFESIENKIRKAASRGHLSITLYKEDWFPYIHNCIEQEIFVNYLESLSYMVTFSIGADTFTIDW